MSSAKWQSLGWLAVPVVSLATMGVLISTAPNPSVRPAVVKTPPAAQVIESESYMEPSLSPEPYPSVTSSPDTPKVAPTTKPAAPRKTTKAPGAYYANCAAVRAAGAAPLRRGDPGYRPGLDRDGDGVACEK